MIWLILFIVWLLILVGVAALWAYDVRGGPDEDPFDSTFSEEFDK